ncbi:MAG: Gfo/Idh/MocA family oxidoreductase, partial [Eubacteriales bacterium]|nr:Gfo/Idh/MocA family oxidoreductase [Eubacteriales bacterium]
MEKLRIGVIGCGGIARGTHLPGIEKSDCGLITALCDINEKTLNEAGDKYGVPAARRFTDYRELIVCGDVDAADICTPNNLHCEMAQEAVKAGKPFCVEKPVGINYGEVKKLEEATAAAGVKAMVCFSYRFRPAVRYAKHLAEQGIFGEINGACVQYLKSSAFMKGRRLDWRFDEKQARYGVSGDLGVHLIDLVQFLAGDIT